MNIDHLLEFFSRHSQPFGHGTRRIVYRIHILKNKNNQSHTILKMPVYNPLPPPLPVKAYPKLAIDCVVPENIHTPPTEDTLICSPPPPRIFHSKGVFDNPPFPQEFPEFLNGDFFMSKWFWYFRKNRK